MNRTKGVVRSATVRCAMLLFCNVFIPGAHALDAGNSTLSLHVAAESVSADIKEARLVDVARALQLKTDATFYFQRPQVKDQIITARFENLPLEAALSVILEQTNHAVIAEQDAGIHVYIYSEVSEDIATNRLVLDETAVDGQSLNVTSQLAETQAEDPQTEDLTEMPTPPDVFDSDPAVRARELEGIVAADGPQSLAIVLAAAQDPDVLLRSTSVRLLLNDLRDAVPREDLTRIAHRSDYPDIRLQALEALAEREDWPNHARMTLDGALRDSDPLIQRRAEELLLELSESEPKP